jgi:hypothetical protein
MDPFVRRLVQRLLDPAQPLSRNRHFATFQSAEGRAAMRVTRRLRSLQRDVEACRAQGNQPRVVSPADEKGGILIELKLRELRGTRSTRLAHAEFELLRSLPGMDVLPSFRRGQ